MILDTAVDAGGANPGKVVPHGPGSLTAPPVCAVNFPPVCTVSEDFANSFAYNPTDNIAYGKFTDSNTQHFFCHFAADQVAEPMECLCVLSTAGSGGSPAHLTCSPRLLLLTCSLSNVTTLPPACSPRASHVASPKS